MRNFRPNFVQGIHLFYLSEMLRYTETYLTNSTDSVEKAYLSILLEMSFLYTYRAFGAFEATI